MRNLLTCEFLKTRKRYVLLSALVITIIELCWILGVNYSEDVLQSGWMLFLYQMPLVNAIFVPLLSIIVASRLCDIEHKGVMLKHLCALAPRGKLYDAKLLYGLGIVLITLAVQFAGLFAGGIMLGFGGAFPVKLYALYWLFTVVPTIEIYIVQHTISLALKNQSVPFFVGIIGAFCGIFSMYLSQIPWLNKFLLWGHFGALQFVGNDWTQETRISHFYLADIDWSFFGVAVIVMILLYVVGKKLFCEREV